MTHILLMYKLCIRLKRSAINETQIFITTNDHAPMISTLGNYEREYKSIHEAHNRIHSI